MKTKYTKGFTLVELLVVIAILGTLMAVLVPKIMSSITESKLSSAATQGKKLFDAITTQGLNREGSRTAYLPRNTADDGLISGAEDQGDRQPINSKTFSSSTEYFKYLLQLDKQGKERNPFVKDVEVADLAGFGVPAAKSNNITADNIAWTVAAGATEGCPSTVPVFITRNVAVDQLITEGTKETASANQEVNLERKPTPFGDDGFVIVTLGGEARALHGDQNYVRDIYKGASVTIPENIKLKYLLD